MSDQWRNPWAPAEPQDHDDDSAEASISHSTPIEPGMVVQTAPHNVLGEQVSSATPETVELRPMPEFAEPDAEPVPAPEQPPVYVNEISNSASFSNTVDREDFDRTIMSRASTHSWTLRTSTGVSPEFAIGLVVVGRAPAVSPEFIGAQVVAMPDPTRTMSKTHALLEYVSGAWHVTDLESTNGVVLVDEMGNETDLTPGERTLVRGKFLLGDQEMWLEQVDG